MIILHQTVLQCGDSGPQLAPDRISETLPGLFKNRSVRTSDVHTRLAFARRDFYLDLGSAVVPFDLDAAIRHWNDSRFRAIHGHLRQQAHRARHGLCGDCALAVSVPILTIGQVLSQALQNITEPWRRNDPVIANNRLGLVRDSPRSPFDGWTVSDSDIIPAMP